MQITEETRQALVAGGHLVSLRGTHYIDPAVIRGGRIVLPEPEPEPEAEADADADAEPETSIEAEGWSLATEENE